MARPEHKPSKRNDTVRGALIASVGLLVFCLSFMSSDIFGRVVPGAVFFFRTGAWLVGSFASAVAMLAAHKLLPQVESHGWLAVPVVVVLPCLLLAMVGPIVAHMEFGTPASTCQRSGLEVDLCEGRDWSLMQGRHGYQLAAGSVDADVCRSFQARVPESPQSPLRDGWVRCPFDDPTRWRAHECAPLGFARMASCFVCAGRSTTNDDFSHARGFSEDCTRGVAFYGKNVHPRDAEECSRSTARVDCPSGRLAPTGGR